MQLISKDQNKLLNTVEECLYGKWSPLDYLNLPEIINIIVCDDIKYNKGLKYSIYELLPLFY